MATESLEDRVKKLERRYRLVLAGIGLAVLACAVVWVVAGATSRAQAQNPAEAGKVIRVRKLILEDEKSKPRVWLGVTQDGPVLDLDDEKGKTRVLLAVRQDMPGLGLYDEKGKDRVLLGVSQAGPGLDLYDEKGKTCVLLAVSQDGPGLFLNDEKGKTIWSAP